LRFFGWAHRARENPLLLKNLFNARTCHCAWADIKRLPASTFATSEAHEVAFLLRRQKIGNYLPGLFQLFPGPDCLVEKPEFCNEKPPAGKEGQKMKARFG